MFRPIDIISIAYLLLLNTLILCFQGNLQRWWFFVLLHLGIMACITLLVVSARRLKNRPVHFLREWYPGLLFIVGFEEINFLVDMVTRRRFHEALIRLDKVLFGVHPGQWLEQFARPWLTELMMFCFVSFYLLIPCLGLVLYVNKKWLQFQEFMLAAGVTFYLCFAAFLFFPAEGPWVTMRNLYQEPLRGGYITALASFVENLGTIRGGAFPSSHVAVALVVLVMAWRHQRVLFYGLLPVILGLFISTVYGRFHYAVDVLSGWLIGLVGLVLGIWLHRKWVRSISGESFTSG